MQRFKTAMLSCDLEGRSICYFTALSMQENTMTTFSDVFGIRTYILFEEAAFRPSIRIRQSQVDVLDILILII